MDHLPELPGHTLCLRHHLRHRRQLQLRYLSTDFPTSGAYDATCGTDGLCNPGDIFPYASDVFVTVLSGRPDLSTSRKEVSPALIVSTETLTHTLAYTLTLANTGDVVAGPVVLTDTLPAALTLETGPTCTGGTCGYQPGMHAITWTGSISPGVALTLTYTGAISVSAGTPALILNTAQVDDSLNPPFELAASVAVNPHRLYLPLVGKMDE